VATKRQKKVASRLTVQISIMVAGLLLFNTAAFGDTPFRDQALSVPMVDGRGNTRHLAGRLCVPDGSTGNARLVLINHGSSDPKDRPGMRPAECSSETAQWFLQRGFAVAFVLRRGYGTTGGQWEEDAGPCSRPDFIRQGWNLPATSRPQLLTSRHCRAFDPTAQWWRVYLRAAGPRWHTMPSVIPGL
jgi:hypothetical protein